MRVRLPTEVSVTPGGLFSDPTRIVNPETPPDRLVRWQAQSVDMAARSRLKGHRAFVLWLTGIPAAGKSTIANLLDSRLHAMGRHTYLLDGDNLRHGLNQDLGFTLEDRAENVRRVAEVARLMADAGLVVIVALISPARSQRDRARALFPPGQFIEVFVDTPQALAEARDPKGLYRKAREGSLGNFTGIGSPYEPPHNPDIRIDGARLSAEAAVGLILQDLQRRGL